MEQGLTTFNIDFCHPAYTLINAYRSGMEKDIDRIDNEQLYACKSAYMSEKLNINAAHKL